MRVTVPSCSLATQTDDSRVPTDTARGARPTRMRATMPSVSGLTRVTMPLFRLATHTPSAPAATATGPSPTSTFSGYTCPLTASSRRTLPSPSFATHTPPVPIDRPVGWEPTYF